LPLPRLHPEVRFQQRFGKMNGMKSYKRISSDGKEVVTNYPPDNSRRILSEEGYQQEVM